MNYFEMLENDVARIESDLLAIPDELADVERAIANDRRRLTELQESLELAETNASLMANADGKSEDIRKIQRKAAIWQDGEVQRWQAEIRKVQESLDNATVTADTLRRKYGALCYVAELNAAKLKMMATARA